MINKEEVIQILIGNKNFEWQVNEHGIINTSELLKEINKLPLEPDYKAMYEELNRLQLLFESIPSDEIRTLLKRNGFKWSPKNNAWQRQLTNNAISTTKIIIKQLEEEDYV